MESKKFNLIQNKIKKWALGKADNDYDLFYLPAKETLENFLHGRLIEEDPIKRLVNIQLALQTYSTWHYDKFLGRWLNENDARPWVDWFEAAASRLASYVLGYTKPNHTAPTNESEIACAICDAIFLQWHAHAQRIIAGFIHQRHSMVNPQSVIQFAMKLYDQYIQKQSVEASTLFNKPLVTAYSELLQNMAADVPTFVAALHKACEFHLERSKSSLDYEFGIESDMIFPAELLASIRVRKQLGYSVDGISHPLVTPHLLLFEVLVEEQVSPLLKSVIMKIDNEYLQPNTI